jgi:hypothetical protein
LWINTSDEDNKVFNFDGIEAAIICNDLLMSMSHNKEGVTRLYLKETLFMNFPNQQLHQYQVDVFLRFPKQLNAELINGRLCLKADNPLIESISVEEFSTRSKSNRYIAGKTRLALELNVPVDSLELETITADICQSAMHKKVSAILPWEQRHCH